MCQTLSGVVGSAEPKRRDASKYELHPACNWQGLANEAMRLDHDLPYLPVYALLEVEFEVDAHGYLGDEHEHDVGNEFGVDVLGELSALVLMAEEVPDDCEEGANCLYGHVPFRAYYLESSQAIRAMYCIVYLHLRPFLWGR